jgi:hypothetical protein
MEWRFESRHGLRMDGEITDCIDIDPFGARPEPGARLIAPIMLLPPREAPEGRAGADPQPPRPCADAHSGGPSGNRALRRTGAPTQVRLLQ